MYFLHLLREIEILAYFYKLIEFGRRPNSLYISLLFFLYISLLNWYRGVLIFSEISHGWEKCTKWRATFPLHFNIFAIWNIRFGKMLRRYLPLHMTDVGKCLGDVGNKKSHQTLNLLSTFLFIASLKKFEKNISLWRYQKLINKMKTRNVKVLWYINNKTY